MPEDAAGPFHSTASRPPAAHFSRLPPPHRPQRPDLNRPASPADPPSEPMVVATYCKETVGCHDH
jgi:hypothetical protein